MYIHICIHIYIYREREREKEKAKLAEKYMWKRNMKSFSNETLKFFLQKVLGLLHFACYI